MKTKSFENTIKWYNEHAEEYSKFSYALVQTDVIETFMTMLPKKPSILDAGCGPGRDAALFFQKGAKVTGLDISTELIKIARRKHPYITFVEGIFLHLPFKAETFDGVWAHAALVHLETIEDVKRSLEEFYRVLKRGGITNVYVREQSKGEEFAIVKDKDVNNERFFKYFTMEEIRKYLEEAGFTIRKATFRESQRRKGLRWISVFAKK